MLHIAVIFVKKIKNRTVCSAGSILGPLAPQASVLPLVYIYHWDLVNVAGGGKLPRGLMSLGPCPWGNVRIVRIAQGNVLLLTTFRRRTSKSVLSVSRSSASSSVARTKALSRGAEDDRWQSGVRSLPPPSYPLDRCPFRSRTPDQSWTWVHFCWPNPIQSIKLPENPDPIQSNPKIAVIKANS